MAVEVQYSCKTQISCKLRLENGIFNVYIAVMLDEQYVPFLSTDWMYK